MNFNHFKMRNYSFQFNSVLKGSVWILEQGSLYKQGCVSLLCEALLEMKRKSWLLRCDKGINLGGVLNSWYLWKKSYILVNVFDFPWNFKVMRRVNVYTHTHAFSYSVSNTSKIVHTINILLNSTISKLKMGEVEKPQMLEQKLLKTEALDSMLLLAQRI